jgi:hypothetical protein
MNPRIFAFASVLATLIAPLSTCNHPFAKLSPTSLTFGSQVVLTSSAAKVVTLTNYGPFNTSSLTISSIMASGDYSQTNDCPSTLAPRASCSINVTFAPNVLGTIKGAITVLTSAPGDEVVNLVGNVGVAPVALSPPSLNFGLLPVGTTSAVKTVSVTNNQTATVAINGISTTGDYSQVNNCPSSLSAGAACTISVSFHPTVTGSVPGALTLSSNAVPGTQPVKLSGSGSGSVTSQVAFSPKSLAFGVQEAGTVSPAKTVTLKNVSTSSSLTVSAVISSGANYPVTNTCTGQLLAPGGTCTISADFEPNADFATANYFGGITVLDSAGTSPHVVGLSGAGVPPLTASPSSLRLTAVKGSTSPAQTVTLANRHSTAETLTIVTTGYYTMTHNGCTNSLPTGGSCSIDLTFTAPGSQSGNISGAATIMPSSGGTLSPEVVSLTGCVTLASLSPSSLSFGSETVGTSSSPQVVTLTNVGGGTLDISSVATGGSDGGDFVISNNTCGSSLASGARCTVSVEFKPKATGNRSGTLNFFDSGGCSPQQVLLAGTGT